ncbi:MAG: CsbD family protein [Pseudomonadota bacterium]
MNNEDRSPVSVDDDRTEGSIKKMGGNFKEGAGNLVGDEKMKREGQADQAKGTLQNAWGSVKDKASEVTGSDDR